MGKKGIEVHLEIEDMLKRDPSKEYGILKKNIGTDKSMLVRDVVKYMANPKSDELNSEPYNLEQIDTAKIVESEYILDPSAEFVNYKTTSGDIDRMELKDKLSKYSDAFHSEGNVEFGVLEEEGNLEEKVYLTAIAQAIGGKR